MSVTVDRRRREDAHDAAIERGKAKLRLLQSVLAHFTEGLSARESAQRLGVHRVTVQKWRGWLLHARRGDWVDGVTKTGGDSGHV